jgi:uncharacterized membrane protein YphA (DoxX/SURF4 family)
MRRLLDNDYLVVGARFVLGILFIIASADKLAAPEAFAGTIANYRIVPETLTLVIATVLPWVELLCGLALFLGILQRGSALLLSTLLVAFTLIVVSALVRGLDISCGCFTQDPAAGRIGWMKIVENLAMLALASFLFFATSVKFSLESYIVGRQRAEPTEP